MRLVNIFIKNASAISFEFADNNAAYAMIRVLRDGRAEFNGFMLLPHPCGEAWIRQDDILGYSCFDTEALAEEGIKCSILKHRLSRDHDRQLEADYDKEQELLKGPVGVGS